MEGKSRAKEEDSYLGPYYVGDRGAGSSVEGEQA